MSDASAAPEEAATKTDIEKAPAIGIQMSTQLGPDRSLQLSCWLPYESTTSELNFTLDKFWNASERLEARSKIEILKKAIEERERARAESQKQIAKLDFAKKSRETVHANQRRQGELKPQPGEAQTYEAVKAAIETYTAQIAKFKADLADLERVAYSDVDGSPNLRVGSPDRES